MIKLIILLAFVLNLPLWADQSKRYFCSESADIQAKAANLDNELAFSNPSGMDLGFLGKIFGYEDGIGACWWHSKMQRAGLFLAMFRPEEDKPSAEQAIQLIKQLRQGKKVVEIPGYNNLREFSRAWADEFDAEITQWQKSNTFKGQWLRAVDAKMTHLLNPEQLKGRMEELYQRIGRGEIVFQRLPYRDDLVVHAWIVTNMVPLPNGYRLSVIDSNQRYFYSVGTSGHYEVDYYYGDRYLSYRGSKIVPRFELSQKDYERLQSTRDAYCKGVEPYAIEGDSGGAAVDRRPEEVELSQEQIRSFLYNFLVAPTVTREQVVFARTYLRPFKEQVVAYFNNIIALNDDFHPQVSYRIAYLALQFSDIRSELEDSMAKMVAMPSTVKETAVLVCYFLLGEGDFSLRALDVVKMVFEAFDLRAQDYFGIAYALSQSAKPVVGVDFIFEQIFSRALVYTGDQLAFLAKAVIVHQQNEVFLKQILEADSADEQTLQGIAYQLIENNFSRATFFLEIILSHPKCDYGLLTSLLYLLEKKWPLPVGSWELLKQISSHELADQELRDKVQECAKEIERKQRSHDVLKYLDFENFIFESYGLYEAQVSIDSSKMGMERYSFDLLVGGKEPIRIKVSFADFLGFAKNKALRLVFEAPAHFDYSTEKDLFETIFGCAPVGGCQEVMSGAMVVGDNEIAIYDRNGSASGSRLLIRGTRVAHPKARAK